MSDNENKPTVKTESQIADRSVTPFIVCLHDVCPRSEREVTTQLTALRPLVGARISVAVIPAASGGSWRNSNANFLEALYPLERLLHGFLHQRPPALSLISYATGHCDEFAGLPSTEIACRLSAGQQVMADVFGRPAAGLLPPAWRPGAMNLDLLACSQMAFQVGYGSVTRVKGGRLPLATYSWDWGPAAFWGRFGTPLGRMCALRPGSVRVIALHPSDEARGFLCPALDLVRNFLGRGFVPMRFSELLGGAA